MLDEPTRQHWELIADQVIDRAFERALRGGTASFAVGSASAPMQLVACSRLRLMRLYRERPFVDQEQEP